MMASSESNIPEAVRKHASSMGISIAERGDDDDGDFVATTDKLPGQEFAGDTARKALDAAVKGLGLDPSEAPPEVSQGFKPNGLVDGAGLDPVTASLLQPGALDPNDAAGGDALPGAAEAKPKAEAKPADDAAELPGLKGKAKGKQKTPGPGKGKTVAEAVAESPKEEPGEETEKVEEAEKPADPEPVAKEKKPARVLAAKAPEPAKEPEPEAKSAEVVNLSAHARKKAGKEEVKVEEKSGTKEEPKAAKKAKGRPKVQMLKIKPKVADKPKAAKPKVDGPTNGNGRKRGKRWAVKELVLADPTMAVDDLLEALKKDGVESSTGSVGSIRMDFMATLRAAKALGKLKADVAKRVPDPKAKTPKASTTVLGELNRIVIGDPSLDAKACAEALRKTIDKNVLQRAGTQLRASRAAIIESIEVMKEAKAFK